MNLLFANTTSSTMREDKHVSFSLCVTLKLGPSVGVESLRVWKNVCIVSLNGIGLAADDGIFRSECAVDNPSALWDNPRKRHWDGWETA